MTLNTDFALWQVLVGVVALWVSVLLLRAGYRLLVRRQQRRAVLRELERGHAASQRHW